MTAFKEFDPTQIQPQLQTPEQPSVDIGIDVASWPGQTAAQLEQLVNAVPQANGFIIRAGEADLLDMAKSIADSGRAVILDDADTNIHPETVHKSWSNARELALHGVQYVIKPYFKKSNELIADVDGHRHGLSAIVTVTPAEWQTVSGVGGELNDPTTVARSMLAMSSSYATDGMPRVLMPNNNDFWSNRLRRELISQNEGVLYLANTPSPTVQNALRRNPRQAIRAIIAPPGGAEQFENPLDATVHEAERVTDVLRSIDLIGMVQAAEHPTEAPAKVPIKPQGMSQKELFELSELLTPRP